MIPRRRIPVRAGDVMLLCRSLRPPGEEGRAVVRAFEEAFRDDLGCAFARATASGRDAMMLAFKSAGVMAGMR
ncbi:MAG: hypothetical protein M5R36_14970 [Deltaproteobacteria bacterium]|nr:hypothetical protein [Deltaproteobacteria bacterium]